MSLSKPVYNFLGFYFQQLHTNPVVTKSITRLVSKTLIVTGIRLTLFYSVQIFFFRVLGLFHTYVLWETSQVITLLNTNP